MVERAQNDAHASVYMLGNPFTTIEEKLEIERWYQLPIDIAGFSFLAGLFYYATGAVTGWQLFLAANAIGIVVAMFCWFTYSRVLVASLFALFGNSLVSWAVHLGVAAWFFTHSRPWLGGFAIANQLTGGMALSLGAMFFYQLVTRRYRIHPKYAFLKHFYGKTYPFESNRA
jgi:hypothetical protein